MIRLIGDVHGKHREYVAAVADAEWSLCVGDVWAKDGDLPISPTRHRIVAGNHEPYGYLSAHYLSDYGSWKGVWYLRGADSIDKHLRVPGVSWFPEEQLTWPQLEGAVKSFEATRPDVVVTHDCPKVIKDELVRGNVSDRTSVALNDCLRVHQPKLWVFGHHHVAYDEVRMGTRFVCLPELAVMDIEPTT